MSSENRIELFRNETRWLAEFVGPHAEEVNYMFGRNTLETPFGSRKPAGIVRKVIARAFVKWGPDIIVTVRKEKQCILAKS
jgi:hypothetical protein